MRYRGILLSLVLSAALCSPLTAQDLPDYTMEQRWARAEGLLNSWVVFGIRYSKMMGQSLEQFADALVEVYGPGWSSDMGPLDMLRAMHRNWMWQRGAEFEVLEATDDVVRFRANRAYLPDYFGDDGQSYGVTVEEYEKVLELFQREICTERGMTYESNVEGSWVYVTIRKQ
jgi:hypothetical protein